MKHYMNIESASAVNYQYDEILPSNQSNPLFDEDLVGELTPGDSFSERVPSVSADPPQNSFTFEYFEAPIITDTKRTKKARIKNKALRAKTICSEKRKLIRKEPILNEKPSLAVRNRLSAQRSREKKRNELSTLKQANERLIKEKQETEEKLALATAELEAMKATVELLSPENRAEFDSIHFGLNKAPSTGKVNKRGSSLVLAAGALLGCICIIYCFVPFTYIENTVVSTCSFLESPEKIKSYPRSTHVSSKYIDPYGMHLYLVIPVLILILCFLIRR